MPSKKCISQFSSFVNLNLKLKDGLLFRNLLSLIFKNAYSKFPNYRIHNQ